MQWNIIIKDEVSWYYLNASGEMETEWLKTLKVTCNIWILMVKCEHKDLNIMVSVPPTISIPGDMIPIPVL